MANKKQIKGGCQNIGDIQQAGIWYCYQKNSMVDIKDCQKCKYGKILNIK